MGATSEFLARVSRHADGKARSLEGQKQMPGLASEFSTG